MEGETFPLEFLTARGIEPASNIMSKPKKPPSKSRRIVLKFGSGILTRTNAPGLDLKQFARLSAEVAALIQAGHQCVAVTSGAVAAGTSALSLTERPTDLATAQASAAIGQSKLMRAWETAFARYKLNVAQLLLTYSDLDSYVRRANAGNTLERLLAAGNVVPIINENDSVATGRIELWRQRSALGRSRHSGRRGSAHHSHPGRWPARRKRQSHSTGARHRSGKKLANGNKGRFSRGGMISKLEAVKMAVEAGITTVIINGRHPERIAAVVAGKETGTRFIAKARPLRAVRGR